MFSNLLSYQKFSCLRPETLGIFTLGILIRVMPYIRVMGGKIVKSLIRVMPIIRVMPGKLKVYQSKFVI